MLIVSSDWYLPEEQLCASWKAAAAFTLEGPGRRRLFLLLCCCGDIAAAPALQTESSVSCHHPAAFTLRQCSGPELPLHRAAARELKAKPVSLSPVSAPAAAEHSAGPPKPFAPPASASPLRQRLCHTPTKHLSHGPSAQGHTTHSGRMVRGKTQTQSKQTSVPDQMVRDKSQIRIK